MTRIKAEPGLGVGALRAGRPLGLRPERRALGRAHLRRLDQPHAAHIAVGKAPDQVAFTDAFAYVRSLGTEEVSAVRL